MGFPVTEDGTVLRHLCREHWHKRRRLDDSVRKEKTQKTSTYSALVRIQTPNQHDVLLGRGRAYYTHIGNMRLRNLIMEHLPRYHQAPFTEKQRVSDSIVDILRTMGGRFLREEEAWWVEVDRAAAQKKVRTNYEAGADTRVVLKLKRAYRIIPLPYKDIPRIPRSTP